MKLTANINLSKVKLIKKGWKMKKLLLLLLFILTTMSLISNEVLSSQSETISLPDGTLLEPAQVIRVIDGDTIKVRRNNQTKEENVRLFMAINSTLFPLYFCLNKSI